MRLDEWDAQDNKKLVAFFASVEDALQRGATSDHLDGVAKAVVDEFRPLILKKPPLPKRTEAEIDRMTAEVMEKLRTLKQQGLITNLDLAEV